MGSILGQRRVLVGSILSSAGFLQHHDVFPCKFLSRVRCVEREMRYPCARILIGVRGILRVGIQPTEYACMGAGSLKPHKGDLMLI